MLLSGELAIALLGAIFGGILGGVVSYLVARYQIRQAKNDADMREVRARLSPVLGPNTATRLEIDTRYPTDLKYSVDAVYKALVLDGQADAANRFRSNLEDYIAAAEVYATSDKSERDREAFERVRVRTSDRVIKLMADYEARL